MTRDLRGTENELPLDERPSVTCAKTCDGARLVTDVTAAAALAAYL